MTRAERAKQFLPFSALDGLEERISAQEFVPEERRFLGEDAQAELDAALRELRAGDTVTVTYYRDRQYKKLTGPAMRLDPVHRILAVGETIIPLADLYALVRL